MATLVFTGRIGGINSQLGCLALGYDPLDEAVVTWVKNTHLDNNSAEMIFGYDEGGMTVAIYPNTPTILNKAQVRQAQKDGAILVIMESI